jgi:hypothetical protein
MLKSFKVLLFIFNIGPKIDHDISKLSFPRKLKHYFSYFVSGIFNVFGLVGSINGDWAFKGLL